MEFEAVKKWTKSFGFIFIILSIIELINTIFLLNAQVKLKGETYSILELIFYSRRVPLTSSYIFVFLICSIFCFLIFGFLLIKIISYNIEYDLMAKYLLILGVLILLFSYIKMGYITYLERAKVILNGDSILFKYFVWKYNTSIIGPYDLLVSWTLYTAVVCCYLMIGLIVAGGGLNWILEISQKRAEEESPSLETR